MELKTTLKIAVLLFLVGTGLFYYFRGPQEAIWFAIGAALALMNVFVAAWSIQFGLKSAKKSATFLMLLLVKSMSFLLVVGVVLVFLKPLLLPFTLGITIVIVASVLAAIWELKRRGLKTI